MKKLNSFITIIGIVTVLIFLTAAESKETYDLNAGKTYKKINLSEKLHQVYLEKPELLKN